MVKKITQEKENKIFTGSKHVYIALILSGFLITAVYGISIINKQLKLQERKIDLLQEQLKDDVKPEQPLIPVKQEAKIIKDPILPAQVPSERKKVAVTLTEPTIAGTYYCYEDKANTVAQKQTSLNNLHKLADFCSSDIGHKITSCFNSCGQRSTTCISNCLTSSDQTSCNDNCISQGNSCTDECPDGTECDDKSDDVMEAQDELRDMVWQYCP
ncbi:hypothetical protein KKA27_03465 [Patescibacteria group bacterium]|nr:hypothetical protein [Patescibacteria group bacterium]